MTAYITWNATTEDFLVALKAEQETPGGCLRWSANVVDRCSGLTHSAKLVTEPARWFPGKLMGLTVIPANDDVAIGLRSTVDFQGNELPPGGDLILEMMDTVLRRTTMIPLNIAEYVGFEEEIPEDADDDDVYVGEVVPPRTPRPTPADDGVAYHAALLADRKRIIAELDAEVAYVISPESRRFLAEIAEMTGSSPRLIVSEVIDQWVTKTRRKISDLIPDGQF